MRIKDRSPKPTAQPKPATRPVEWEHRSISFDEHGAAPDPGDGWELVSVVRATAPDIVIAFFKRRK